MDTVLQEVIECIRRSNQREMIGISGHGAAGKTTFAKKLIEQLGDENVNYILTDPYIIDSGVRKNTMIDYTYKNKHHRFKMTACHPAAHHLPSLERDLQMIQAGLGIYTINTHYLKQKYLPSTNQVTIVEGMSVAFIDPEYFDRTIYLYTDSETEFNRRSVRDIEERGMDIEYLRQSHAERRIQYELFMHPYSRQFDTVIDTSKGTTEGKADHR